MKRVIHKFTIDLHLQEQTISVPKDAEFLSIQNQADKICMWMAVDPEVETEEIKIKLIGTGETMDASEFESFVYLGSVQVQYFFWHVFQVFE